MAVPIAGANSARLPVSVVPFRWGQLIAVNIADAAQNETPNLGSRKPSAPLTRAYQVRGEQAANGLVKLTLDVVSLNGPREFYLDLAVMLLGESGELISAGHCSTSLRVEYQPVEKAFEIELGKIRDGAQPKFVAIGAAPGNVVAAPLGSKWGWSMNVETPFGITTLLAETLLSDLKNLRPATDEKGRPVSRAVSIGSPKSASC